jgi:hypothetical protein
MCSGNPDEKFVVRGVTKSKEIGDMEMWWHILTTLQ